MAKKTDDQIQREVHEEWAWDTHVEDRNIRAVVNRGIVTLTGIVTSWTAHVAARDAANRVAGVVDVINEIRVVLSNERSDAEIAEAVRHALEWDVLVPNEKIEVTLSQGVVTLAGNVDLWSQHDDAERALRNIRGVKEVKNHIVVEPRAVASQAVHEAIHQALERRAAHLAKHIHVDVHENRVVLTGEVASRGDLRTIEGAVKGTLGVGVVDNQLRIGA